MERETSALSESDNHLSGGLLKRVSRSFYLTLRLLPGSLRGPVSLGYLLARASDTVADAGTLDAGLRLALLDKMSQWFENGRTGEGIDQLESEVVPVLDDDGEKELLRRLPECLEWLGALPIRLQSPIREVLRPIVRGQRLDVERFPDAARVRSLRTAADLEEYTCLVAGCVGEFWTRMCVAELGDSCFRENADIMASRGVAFGKGLQLVNVLRDLREDLDAGRCYLPEAEIRAGGGSVEGLADDPGRLLEVAAPWEDKCLALLAEGMDYIDAIEVKRLRYATALPLLLGVRTIALLQSAGWEQRSRGIKVSRREVSAIMAAAAVAAMREGGLRQLYEQLAQTK